MVSKVLILSLLALTMCELYPKAGDKIADDTVYIGVNDHQVDLFEGQYKVPNGIAYNSYMILDDKIAIFDTVSSAFRNEWLQNIDRALNGKKPTYLIIQHMEPDHAANVDEFMKVYKDTKVVSSKKAFEMMKNYFETDYESNRIVVKEGDTLNTGKHTFAFVEAPMVHWPEVIVSYDTLTKTLFSADGFGKFGALDVTEPWDDEARRYYIGIVGKYGKQVQSLLRKASGLEIKLICPTHGPMLNDNLGYYIKLYDTWSSYSMETEGILICYTTVYGHTKQAIEYLAEQLKKNGAKRVVIHDLARTDMSIAIADAFRFPKIILATTTYNAGIFPWMHDFIVRLVERDFQRKKIGLIENGSWSLQAIDTIKKLLKDCKEIKYLRNEAHILSALNDQSEKEIDELAKEITEEYRQQGQTGSPMELNALFNIGYGLYVVTSNDGKKDNGFICNAVFQLTDKPNRVAVTINKDNYSHMVIKQTGKMNVNILSTEAPFSIFKHFGFQSGKTVDKFEGKELKKAGNGIAFLTEYVNSMISLEVKQYIDLGTHGLFICEISEARVFNKVATMTYAYYHSCVKPQPGGDKGYVCKICGFVYDADILPKDYICPLCKHCATDFEKIIPKK